MSGTPTPRYNRPPVNEVALAAQFDALRVGAYRLARLADALTVVGPGHPEVVERPALPPLPPRGASRGISLQLVDMPEPPLLWLLDRSGHHLIQLQRDRLVVNWRKLSPNDPYPSFDSLLPRWKQAWDALERAVASESLGPLRPNACELTYFNAIDGAADIAELVAPWSAEFSDAFLHEPTEVRLAASFALPGDDGHLSIEVTPGIRQDTGQATTLLRVGARGWPSAPGHESVLHFFDVAHEWIVRGFTSFTTQRMHREWERTDVLD